MKKTAHIAGVATLAALGFCLPAQAQYYEYHARKPSVELNLEALGDLDQPAMPAVPREKPEAEALPPPSPVTPPPAAAPAPLLQPRQRVLKPTFAEEEPQPDSTAAPGGENFRKLLTTTAKKNTVAVPPHPPVEKELRKKVEKKSVFPPPLPAASAEDQEEPSAPVVEEQTEEEASAPRPEAAAPAPAAVPALSDLSIAFTGNGSDIAAPAERQLAGVAAQMKEMPDMRLQVRAYATGEDGNRSSARRVSLSRALSVRAWLMDNGIKPTRIDVRALGAETDRNPLDRVDLVFVR